MTAFYRGGGVTVLALISEFIFLACVDLNVYRRLEAFYLEGLTELSRPISVQ